MGFPRLDDDTIIATLKLVELHGSALEASVASGIARGTIQHHITVARKRWPGTIPQSRNSAGWCVIDWSRILKGEQADKLPPGVRISKGPGKPRRIILSEDERKYHPEWTKEDCIAELRRVAHADDRENGNEAITRRRFRIESDISESTWTRFFGTFLEFRRQAGLLISRHAHTLERSIAKHASVDLLRTLNTEKRTYEENYLRPSCRRWQSVLVINDIHDKHCDPFFRRVVIDLCRRAQPEKVIVNGDLFDLPEFSKHVQDPREFDVASRIQWVRMFLGDLRAAAPDAEMTVVEGNHEFRLLRHMSENAQPLMVILQELRGITIASLFGLKDFGINYVARADMTAWNERDIRTELRKNYVNLWDNSLLFGHFPEMRNMGIPGASAHHHRHIVWSSYSPAYGPFEWHQVGCGHRREASYCAGERWSNGALLVHCDTHTKRSQFDYADLSHTGAIVGGKFYERTAEEPVLDLIRSGR